MINQEAKDQLISGIGETLTQLNNDRTPELIDNLEKLYKSRPDDVFEISMSLNTVTKIKFNGTDFVAETSSPEIKGTVMPKEIYDDVRVSTEQETMNFDKEIV